MHARTLTRMYNDDDQRENFWLNSDTLSQLHMEWGNRVDWSFNEMDGQENGQQTDKKWLLLFGAFE